MTTPFGNLSLKLVAVFLGLLLWFHVATEKVYNYRLKVPVAEVFLEDKLVLSRHPPDSVLVEVSATGKQLLRRSWRSRGLRINAAQFPAGRHNLTLTPNNTSLVAPSADVTLSEVVLPSQLELHIDRKSEVTVPVTVEIQPQPDDGFAVKSISEPQPDEVIIRGPSSVVGTYRSVSTAPRPLTRLRNDIEFKLALVPPTGYGLVLQPDSVTVQIEIVPVRTRVIADIPIVLFNTPDGRPLRTNPEIVSVTLAGPPEAVDSLVSSAIVVSADYSERTARQRVAVRIDAPLNVQVKAVSTDSVTVLPE